MTVTFDAGAAASLVAMYVIHVATIVVGATIGYSLQSVLGGYGLTLTMFYVALDVPGPYLGAGFGTVALHVIARRGSQP